MKKSLSNPSNQSIKLIQQKNHKISSQCLHKCLEWKLSLTYNKNKNNLNHVYLLYNIIYSLLKAKAYFSNPWKLVFLIVCKLSPNCIM